MPRSFLRVGLTGSIATGKSFCLRRFAELGAPTIDADVVARAVVAPGTPGFEAVVERFGPGILASDGAIDRPALGRIVFADASARRDLEHIVHPAVYDVVEQWLEEQAAQVRMKGGPPAAIAAIPLLYEAGQQKRFDVIVVAACTPEQQLERLIARDDLTPEDARRRIAAQLQIEEKRRQADFVIDTSGTFEDSTRQVNEVWKTIVGTT